MDAEQQHACLLRKERPYAAQAPTRLAGMHHQRAGQRRAQRVKLALPIARRLIKQRVGLRLAEAGTTPSNRDSGGWGLKNAGPPSIPPGMVAKPCPGGKRRWTRRANSATTSTAPHGANSASETS